MIGLGSQSQLGIGIAISLRDQFSGVASRVSRSLGQMKKDANASITSAMRDYRNQSAGIASVAGAATFGFYSMAKGASEFGHKINQIDILGQGRLGQTRRQLSKFSLGLAKDFAMMPNEVSAGMLENVRAGVNTGMDQVTKYQAAVAKASGESMGSVSEHLLGIANAYEIPYSKFNDVANQTVAAANASMASIYSIGESMQYAGFAAHQSNISFSETLALVAKLSQSNIKGTSAGTALNNMIQYLGTSTSSMASKKQNEMWKRLGLDKGQMGSLMNSGKVFQVIEAMDKAMQGIAPNERISILRGLVNMRGARGMMGSWGSNDPTKSLSGLLSTIQQGGKDDIAMKQAKAMMNDPYSKMEQMQVKWEIFKIQWMGRMAPLLMKIMDKVGWFVEHVLGPIADSPIGTIFGSVIAIGAPLITTLFAFRAAALTATIALRGFSQMGAANIGFRNLMMAGMGTMAPRQAARGYGVLASNAPNMLAGTMMAGNGMRRVAAGQTITYMGRTFKGGQILPMGYGKLNPANFMSPVSQGANGMYRVRGGQSVNWGGNSYRGGQILPRGFTPGVPGSPGFGGIVSGASLASMGGSGAGLGKFGTTLTRGLGSTIGGGISKVAMGLGRFVPILGWGLTLWSIYDVVKGMSASDKEKTAENARNFDPLYYMYQDAMNKQIMGYRDPGAAAFLGSEFFQNSMKQTAARLQQQIVINVDGQQTAAKTLEQEISGQMDNYLPFNIQG